MFIKHFILVIIVTFTRLYGTYVEMFKMNYWLGIHDDDYLHVEDSEDTNFDPNYFEDEPSTSEPVVEVKNLCKVSF